MVELKRITSQKLPMFFTKELKTLWNWSRYDGCHLTIHPFFFSILCITNAKAVAATAFLNRAGV